MKIAVLGTGSVGATIAARLIELGHSVIIGSREKTNEKALAIVNNLGAKCSNSTFNSACSEAEVIFNCTAGKAWEQVFGSIDEKNLNNKLLLDVSNPLDFSNGMPPTLTVCNTSSIGELLQAKFPNAHVVKTLNTMWSGLMVNPNQLNNGDHSVFMSGNSEEAKQSVSSILQSFGWKQENIINLGDITSARGTEMYLPLWLRLYGVEKSSKINIKLVR